MNTRATSLSSVLVPALTMILIYFCAVPVFANAAEPPCFTILVNGAPEDLSVTFLHPDGTELPLTPLKRGWESYFRCFYYNSDLSLEKRDITRGTLRIESASENISYTIDFPDSLAQEYNNIFTLKLSDGTLSDSYPAWRNAALVAMRVLITLAVEGCIIWCFGYRQKRTWVIFLITNLVTQILLNLALTGYIPPSGYWGFAYYGGEALIFIGEAITFAVGFPEKTKKQAVAAALCANAASLFAGALLLSYLPM